MKLILATNNPGKVTEFRHLLNDLPIEIQTQEELGIASIPETGKTFLENATLKAKHICDQTGCWAIADDSGLEVDALNGQPGIYSARFAGKNATATENNAKLIADLTGIDPAHRTARFRSVIVLMKPREQTPTIICEGTWEGSILLSPRGTHGFGYDPIFYVPTENCSAAELTIERKNKMSHRGQAMQCFREKFHKIALDRP